jgi:hypothetical protein
MNGINMGSRIQTSDPGSSDPASEGLLGGMDLSTISALVVLASAFMRR